MNKNRVLLDKTKGYKGSNRGKTLWDNVVVRYKLLRDVIKDLTSVENRISIIETLAGKGIDQEILITDVDTVQHTLKFENGLLIEYTLFDPR